MKTLRFLLLGIVWFGAAFSIHACATIRQAAPLVPTRLSEEIPPQSEGTAPPSEATQTPKPTKPVPTKFVPGIKITPSTESSYEAYVILASGKEFAIADAFGYIEITNPDFRLESEPSQIVSIKKSPAGDFEITFNNNEKLIADQIEGDIEYRGDFGTTTFSISTIKEFYTIKNQYMREIVGNFSQSHYSYLTEITFTSGSSQTLYLADSDLFVSVNYKGLEAELYINRAPMTFDWQQMVVNTEIPGEGTQSYKIEQLPGIISEHRIYTAQGPITFDWNKVVSTKPVDPTIGDFQPQFKLTLSDGSQIPVNFLSHHCINYERECLKVDGRITSELNWELIQEIKIEKNQPVGTIRFSDGNEKGLEAGIFTFDWAAGSISIPYLHSQFQRLSRTTESAYADTIFSHRIRLKNGEEMSGDLEGISRLDTNTAIGVLHLVEIPVDWGLWLSDLEWLEIDNQNGNLSVKGLDQWFPVKVEDALTYPDDKLTFTFMTIQGRTSIPVEEILSLQTTRKPESPIKSFQVQLTTRDNRLFSFICEKVQFVRYPDQIWSGTSYNRNLGAWYWRQQDFIPVRADGSDVDAELSSISRIKLQGQYPNWIIELESARSGESLKGQIIPSEVAAKSPGVMSWDPAREGFWFWWNNGYSFLFVPAASIAEITITEK